MTRDRYADGERFSSAFSITLLRGLAEALRYLHSKRVAHGDVYGHNTLVLDSTGAAKLGDFGASFYYGELAPSSQRLIERVEVRAFGVLCAEVATRIVGAAAIQQRLLAVADDCLPPAFVCTRTPAGPCSIRLTSRCSSTSVPSASPSISLS